MQPNQTYANTAEGTPRQSSYPHAYGPGNGAADLRKAERLILHVKERLGAEWSTAADLLSEAAGKVYTVAESLDRG